MSLVPRWYQSEAAQSLFDYWQVNRGNPLIALPTASGKSVVIALFCYRALSLYPTTRIMVLTHVKELIAQNFKRMKEAWPDAPAGIYSAGLQRRDTRKPITFAGIQSVAPNVDEFGFIDVIIVDEAHLVSPDDQTRYQQVIEALKRVNPKLKVCGLTATYWRQKQGVLTNSVIDKSGASSGIFTDVCYNRTTPDDFRRFIAEGVLSPLVTLKTSTQLDVSDVGMTGGEFNSKQLEAAVDNETTSIAALREFCHYGQNRRAWVVFCSGIEHAKHCAQILNSWGIRTGCIHSKLKGHERDEILRDWYSGKLRCVTNNNILTTGIDYPALDYIGVLRPTMSSVLWVQMLGRGMRVYPGKTNCLVLDFAGNTVRNGPVDDPNIPGRPRPGGDGDMPVKICDACNCYNHTSARYCEQCGAEFPRVDKLTRTASDQALMSAALPQIETFPVTNVLYFNHKKKDTGDRSLHVMYYSGVRAFSKYIPIANAKATHIANTWWRQHSENQPPETMDEALQRTSELRVPTRIKVWVNGKYPDIVGYEFH